MIISGDWIHFTHLIDDNKNSEFISDTGCIRNILSIVGNLHRDGCMNTEKYEEIMVNYFLREVPKLKNKWEIDMVPIEICITVNDFETNTTK